VDATTAVTRWRGEDCDYAMAVEALLARDGPKQQLVG
jgi:glutaredoxin